MTQETEFTFWPNPEQANVIATSSATDISVMMSNNSDIFTSYLHELWKLDDMEKMFNAVHSLRQTLNMDPIELMQQSVPSSIALMCLQYNVPAETASRFLKETYRVVFKSELGIDFKNPLPDGLGDDIDKEIDGLIGTLKSSIQQRNTSLN